MITAEEFERRTGHPPKDDDLERANCPHHGQYSHYFCGWCVEHDIPRFECGDGRINYNQYDPSPHPGRQDKP